MVADIEALPVEDLGVEAVQLLRRQGPVLRCLQSLGFGEGTGADQKGQGRGQHRRPQPALRGPGDAPHPLPEAPLVPRHGGGAAEQVPRPGLGGDQGQQGGAIGPALAVAKNAQRPLVTGQLRVPAAEDSRQPHQRIPPMHRQRPAPQQGPDVVPLAEMRDLMGQHMAEHPRVRRRLRGDVHRRAEHAEQAGGGQARQGIDRQGALHRQGNPEPPEPPGKAQVGEQEHRRQRCCPRQPDSAQQDPGIQRPPGRRSGGLLPSGSGENLDGRPFTGGGPARFLRETLSAGKRLYHGNLRKHPGRLHRGGVELPRHQQPHQRHRPQGVPQPGADPAAKRRPEDQHRPDQQRGGPYPVPQKRAHSPPPFSAWSRMARSSAISSPESSCRRAMALIIMPTLPRYTRSKKFRVSATTACSRSTSGT